MDWVIVKNAVPCRVHPTYCSLKTEKVYRDNRQLITCQQTVKPFLLSNFHSSIGQFKIFIYGQFFIFFF